jgi:hypothetical protein
MKRLGPQCAFRRTEAAKLGKASAGAQIRGCARKLAVLRGVWGFCAVFGLSAHFPGFLRGVLPFCALFRLSAPCFVVLRFVWRLCAFLDGSAHCLAALRIV